MKVLSIEARALTGAGAVKALASLALPGSVVVASEFAGVREQLQQAASAAEGGSSDYQEQIDAIRACHLGIIRELFPATRQSAVITQLQIILGDLEDVLHGVQLLRECSPRTLDLALSFGARLGCLVVAQYLAGRGMAARVEEDPGIRLAPAPAGPPRGEVIDYPGSVAQVRANLQQRGAGGPTGAASGGASGIAVVAGGIAATPEGVPVVLKRDGGDLTAAVVAVALEAELVELWTDRDGVTSADPELVDAAFVLEEISYQEAMELSYFGARMVHPTALVPAMEADIPIRVGNLAHPERPGTLIHRGPRVQGASAPRGPVAGIASIEPVALINIEGGGMVGVPGIAARIFGALAAATVNIIMISQASSEHSICAVFRQAEAQPALRALEAELSGEIQAKLIQRFDLREDLAILAVIGENMRGTPGISGRLFSALGGEGINILAIAQGSSETNISFVVERDQEQRALRVIHRAFLGPVDRPGGPA
ncbi:MAG: aspartate kinase [Spirochaetales bacterium]|nr:aspartate kinase [Spirochaetales bacterium]